MKYLSLEIYKHYGMDFSGKGLSYKTSKCYIACPDGYIEEEKVPQDQIVKLVHGAFGSIILEPVQPVPNGRVGYMFGGCYVASSDGRFSKLIKEFTGKDFYGAIPLHDRTETQEDYNMYD